MADTVGSSFCRGFGACQHSNMQILQVSHFVEKNGGTLVFDLLAQRPLLSEMWNRSFPLQNGFCTFQGLATFLVGSSFCKGLRPQKPYLALQNGNTQPP